MREWIYVITNPAMPGLIKVGYSSRDPEHRARELDGTGSAYQYSVVYCALLDQAYQLEQLVHSALQDCRSRTTREWFHCELSKAIFTIKTTAKENGFSFLLENGYKGADSNDPFKDEAEEIKESRFEVFCRYLSEGDLVKAAYQLHEITNAPNYLEEFNAEIDEFDIDTLSHIAYHDLPQSSWKFEPTASIGVDKRYSQKIINFFVGYCASESIGIFKVFMAGLMQSFFPSEQDLIRQCFEKIWQSSISKNPSSYDEKHRALLVVEFSLYAGFLHDFPVYIQALSKAHNDDFIFYDGKTSAFDRNRVLRGILSSIDALTFYLDCKQINISDKDADIIYMLGEQKCYWMQTNPKVSSLELGLERSTHWLKPWNIEWYRQRVRESMGSVIKEYFPRSPLLAA